MWKPNPNPRARTHQIHPDDAAIESAIASDLDRDPDREFDREIDREIDRELERDRARSGEIAAPEAARRPRRRARGSQITLPADDRTQAIVRPRTAGESIARLLYFLGGAVIAAVVAVYGEQIWHQARRAPAPAVVIAPRVAARAIAAPGGRIELAGDRRTLFRIAGDAPRWTAPQPAPLDAIELAGPLVIGRAGDAIAAIDLDTGRTRFSWSPPAGERWAPQRPSALGACLATITVHGTRLAVRCLDAATGAVRWTAALAGAADCTQPLDLVPGGYVLPCSGWAAVIDERTGAFGVEPASAGLVQDDPPLLLRMRPRALTVAPWSPARRRFLASGEVAYAAAGAATRSAVVYKDRLVLRAVESSDELATIVPRTGAAVAVAAPVYRHADAAPLVRSCGGATSPRYQLLELAPRIGASFDPATAGDRALALLDVETGSLAWTSRKVAGLRTAGAPGGWICRGGRYAVPLELPGRTGPVTALWIVDAETGKTVAAVASDGEPGAGLAGLTADQIDGDRIVGVRAASEAGGAAFELRWRPLGPGLRDARADLADALGSLP
jgi:hypothetical protein